MLSPLIKYATRTLSVLAIAVVAFGPFGAVGQTLKAKAINVGDACDAGVAYPDSLPTKISGKWNGTNCVTDNGYVTPNSVSVTTDSKGNVVNTPGGILATTLNFAAQIIYAVGPGFASWVSSWSAYFLSFIVRLSLQGPIYGLDFLSAGWQLVLSVANMFFILILIRTAFVIMLRAETTRTMQTLAWVIAIALVVNFSFFFTRVIIDAGNILGVQFYNAVTVNAPMLGANSQTDATQTAAPSNTPATPDLTAGIANAIGAEKIIGMDSFNQISASLGGSSWSTFILLVVIFIFAAVIYWVLAIALLMVGLKFFLRIIGLWLVIVFSPLAFVAQTGAGTRQFFSQWLRTLLGLSMYPAVFLFMFMILNMFAGQLGNGLQNFLTNPNGQLQGAATATPNTYPLLVLIANVSIRMMFIITLLYVILKVSDWVIEQAGGFATTLVSRGATAIAGGGLRTAANLGAFAGRNTVGRVAYGAAQNATFKNFAARSGIGSALWRGTSALSRATYDVRNAPGASAAGSRIGVLARASDVNVGRGGTRNRVQSVEETAKRVQAQGEALSKASEKEVRTAGPEAARQAALGRQEAFVERKTSRNVSNLGIPSWGALKGASALRKSLEKARREDKALRRQAGEEEGKTDTNATKTSAAPGAAPSAPTPPPPMPAAPAQAVGRIIPPSDVAPNRLSDSERAARLAPTPPKTPAIPPTPAAPAARAAATHEPSAPVAPVQTAAPAPKSVPEPSRPRPLAPAAHGADSSGEMADIKSGVEQANRNIKKLMHQGTEVTHAPEMAVMPEALKRMIGGLKKEVSSLALEPTGPAFTIPAGHPANTEPHAANDNSPGLPPRPANDNYLPPKPPNDNFKAVPPTFAEEKREPPKAA
jgi:hypothetical protein